MKNIQVIPPKGEGLYPAQWKLKRVVNLITAQEKLPAKYENHKLSGLYKECLECHIEPD